MILPNVKLGFAPTRRTFFDKNEARRFKEILEGRLKAWDVDFVNLDFLNEEGLLFDIHDAPKIAAEFRSRDVDAVFIPHCNFGSEDAAARTARLCGKPVLLWGPRDEAPDEHGRRKRDTQCGMFATSKGLRRLGVTFTYLPNSWIDGPEIEHGLKSFLKVVAAQKALLGARIGQLSTRPKPFWSVTVNEGELMERFGVELVPATITQAVRGVREILEANGAELKALVEDLKSRIRFPNQPDDVIARHAAFILWQRKWAELEGLSAIAVQCWASLVGELKLWVCFANGELTGEGIPVACETDVHAALTALMLQAAASSPTFCADLTIRHPGNENSELLWHCGPFPSRLADEGQDLEVTGRDDPSSEVPGLGQWRLRGGPLTIGRFDGDHGEYSFFMGHARSTEGPHTQGTYVWIEVDDWLDWEDRLMYGPYIHHVVGVHGSVAPILYEACRYIPGLSPDPMGLTEQELRRFWHGPPA